MIRSPLRTFAVLALATLVTFAGAALAHAAPSGPTSLMKLELAKIKIPKVKVPKLPEPKDLVPKVKFEAGGKLAKNKASIYLRAVVTVAGKSIKIPVFDMGLKKSKKSIEVKRKVGKLSVKLKVSWAGTRTITIKGTAKYMKIKVPVPPIKISV